MEGFPTALIYLILFGAILLFNYFMQQTARRQQEEEAQRQQEAQAHEERIAEEEDALPSIWRSAQDPEARPIRAVTIERTRPPEPPAQSPYRRRSAATSLFRTPQALRHAIVAMTVLGPCRANEERR
jgi:hypothetical protein